MQAILMLVRQVNEGRSRSRTSSSAPSRRRRQPQGAGDWWTRSSSCATTFEWRGLGIVPASALRLRPAYADFDAEARFDRAARGGAGQQGLRMRRHPARREAAGTTARCSAPSARPRTRSAPAWCRPRAPARPIRPTAASASTQGRGMRAKATSAQLDIRHGRVDLTHGSGGRAMAQLIERSVSSRLDNEYLRPGQRRGAPAARSTAGW